MGHYGSPYDYVIHIAQIASSRTSLITSFQPPLHPQGQASNKAKKMVFSMRKGLYSYLDAMKHQTG